MEATELIDIKELRIGNLLLYKDEVHYVSMLSLDIDDEYQDIIGVTPIGKRSGEKSDWNRALIGDLKRIPLTEQWFIKLGFKDRSGSLANKMGYGIDINTMIEIAWYKIGDDIRLQSKGSGWTFNTHIIYVHQLQNLYFALTSEELLLKSSDSQTTDKI